MKHWFKSLRLPIVLFASFLTVISFRLSHHLDQALLPTLVVTVIACATMVQNDWRDRVHDRRKGKSLASDRPRHFFLWTLMLWSIAIAIMIYGWISNPRFGILPLLAIVIGIVYSETRRVTLLPLLLVALTSASPTLFPISLGFSSPLLFWLFASTFIIILSREVIKDIDDIIVDHGYKKTLPFLIGVDRARIIASLLIIGSVLIMLIVFNLWAGLFL